MLRRLIRNLKRLVILLVILLIGASAVFISWWQAQTRAARSFLNEQVRETDRIDPAWRWADIIANRETVPDEENGVLIVLQVRPALPPSWRNGDLLVPLSKKEKRLPPNQRSSDESLKSLQEMSAQTQPALTMARSLSHFRSGQFAVPSELDPYSNEPQFPNRADVLTISELLFLDAFRAVQSNEKSIALQDLNAMMGLARSIGDDPNPLSQRIRTVVVRRACWTVERIIGLDDAADLASIQQAFALEMLQPTALRALRADRAIMEESFQLIDRGKVDVADELAKQGKAENWQDRLDLFLDMPVFPSWYGQLLRECNQLIALEKEPIIERYRLYRALKQPPLGRHIPWQEIESKRAIVGLGIRVYTLLGTTLTAIACERYRQRFGHWPESLDVLPKDLLAEVPIDPYSGGRLRYVKEDDGVVIYSVGSDERDDRGSVLGSDRDYTRDLGIRLWNLEERRRPYPVDAEFDLRDPRGCGPSSCPDYAAILSVSCSGMS